MDESGSYYQSLKPLIWLMQLIGIDFTANKKQSLIGWLIGLMFSASWFLINVGTWIIIFFKPSNNYESRTVTFQWSILIMNLYFIMHTVGVHIALLSVAYGAWKDMLAALSRLQDQLKLPRAHFERTRHWSIVGILYIICLEAIYQAILMANMRTNQPLINRMTRCLGKVMEFYPNSFVVLFSLLGWIVATNYQLIARQVDTFKDKTPANVDNYLKQWKKDYNAVSRCAELLNSLSGVLLLIESVCIVVGIIIQSFNVLIMWTKYQALDCFSFFLLIVHISHFWIISYVSDRIRYEALNILRSLNRLELELHERELDCLMNAIHRSPPKISALSFFPISQQMIPTVIGTTLTYLIIFQQFQASEMGSSQVIGVGHFNESRQ